MQSLTICQRRDIESLKFKSIDKVLQKPQMDFILSKKQSPSRSQQKKDLYRLLLARSDIKAALDACDLILKNVDSLKDELLYPLTTAVVVCYARPFTQNKPYGPLPKKYAKFDNQIFQAVHEKLIKARHETFAHSDMNVRKAIVVPPNVVIGRTEKGVELKSSKVGVQVSYYLWQPNAFKDVRDAILDLGSRLQTEIEELQAHLYSGMELPNAKFTIRIDEGL